MLGMGFNPSGQSDNPGVATGLGTATAAGLAAGTLNLQNNNSLFNRQAYVGLSGDFGDIRIGRQLSPFIAAGAGNMHYVGMFGVGRLAMHGNAGVAATFFRDDAIQYTSPAMSGFTLTALTTTDNSTRGNVYEVDTGRYSAFSVSGPVGPINFNAAYHQQRFSPASTAGNAAGEYSGYLAGGTVPIADGLSLALGFISTKTGADANARDDSWNAGLQYSLSGSTRLLAQHASLNRNGQNQAVNQSVDLTNIMVVNALSKRTNLYAGFGWGNGAGATIGTVLGAVNADGSARANATPMRDAAGNATSNNALVLGVSHVF